MTPRRATARLSALTTGALLAAALVAAPAPALAVDGDGDGSCEEPVPSSTQPGYLVADPDCQQDGTPYGPLLGPDGAALSTTYTGIADGQAFRVEVPLDWNGDLVLYAHGYRGTGTTVYVDDPQLRRGFIERGYALAASSYQTNGYDVDQGVEDTYAMLDRVRAVAPEAADGVGQVYVHGVSMGGHITAVLPERYPDAFDAIYPVCGVLGDLELFDYFLDATATAAALTGAEDLRYDYSDNPQEFADLVSGQVAPELFTERPALAPDGQEWSAVVEQRSGGDRPGFDGAFAFWNSFGFAPLTDIPFLFGVYPGLTGGTSLGLSSGNVAGNASTVYQLDDRPALTPVEQELNTDVLRVADDPDAEGIPTIEGDPGIPVLSLHDIGDLFVPFSMEQIYARETARNGQPFVSRAIRGVSHCDFTDAELGQGFDDLVLWDRTGFVPAGDAVTNPAAVSEGTFGCRFTTRAREQFVAPECPDFPDLAESVHARAVRELLAAGVVAGFDDGTFRPRAPITRGQVASVVAEAAGLRPTDEATGFSDVAPGDVHARGIAALADAGVAEGFDDGTFRPNVLVSRGQLASLLARVLDVSATEEDCFSDVATSVHAGAVCALADLGVVQGFADGTFEPRTDVARGQAASLVTRAFG